MKKLVEVIFPIAIVGCGPGYHDPDGNSILVEPSYKSVSANIVKNKCVTCHNSVKKENGIDLSSYEKIFAPEVFPPLIIPFNPEKSSLYKSVLSGKMPKNDRSLSQLELKALYDWIKNGAKKEELPKPTPAPTPTPTPIPQPDPNEPGDDEPGNSLSTQTQIKINLYLRRYV
ncbi:MAG: hypothetical protein A4S09_06345 [Proteobacteria bacterium SG_bin7]|nr:MAG: hypothetical protein A4S09_06345 [Proteobacteria bacterium SG_bin7]